MKKNVFMKKTLLAIVLQFSFLFTFSQTPWQQTSSTGTTNFAYTFAVSGTNLFVGTQGGGVFLSTNNGTTNWAAVNTGLTDPIINSLLVSGSNLFAGTQGGGVFLSTNNGTNWKPVNTGLTNLSIASLAVNGSKIFAGTKGSGVFLSTDNGTSWTPVNSGISTESVYSLAVNGSNLFAGTLAGGIFLSTNDGASWNAVNTGLPNSQVLTMAVMGNNIFAGTNTSGVFLSTNNGSNWKAVNAGLTDLYIHSFVVNGSNLFVGTNSAGIFLSTNNGASWTTVNTGLSVLNIQSLAIISTNIFAGTSTSGVWKNTITNTITGLVYSNGIVNSGYAKLFKYSKNSKMIKADSVNLQSNRYTFYAPTGDYIIYAKALNGTPNTIGTFSDSTYIWDSATVVHATLGANISRNTKLNEMQSVVGTATISGKVKEGIGFKYGKTETAGDAIKGIDIGIRKKPAGTIAGYTTTDATGNYSFSNIAAGNYDIYVSIPGLPEVTTYDLSVMNGAVVSNKDFIADSAKIYAENVNGIENIIMADDGISIWPVPVRDVLKIKNEPNQLFQDIFIENIMGQKISFNPSQIRYQGSVIDIDMSTICDGVYVLIFRNGDNYYRKKIIKTAD